nr:hypothetical protein [Hyphomonas sp. Mor2]
MQGRVFAIITLGFASLFLIGAAGAASDSYFETVALTDTHDVACLKDRMDLDRPDLDRPNCSAHRVSTTFGRQVMAVSLTQQREHED